MKFLIMLCSNRSNTALLWKNKVRQNINSKNLMVHVIQYIDLLSGKIPTSILHMQTGRPSARGSHMSGVWGREKPRQAFPPQNLRRGFESCVDDASYLSSTHLYEYAYNSVKDCHKDISKFVFR